MIKQSKQSISEEGFPTSGTDYEEKHEGVPLKQRVVSIRIDVDNSLYADFVFFYLCSQGIPVNSERF